MPDAGDAPGGTATVAPAADDRRAPQPSMAHVPALDGLRGLAVAAVLLFHGGYLTGGWLGVDLFFVLSGYLITSLLLIEHRSTGGIALVAFWGRRARRLLPAVVAVVLAAAAYAALVLGPADQAAARGDGISTLFFVANWHDILQGTSYWDRGLAPSLFAHTWSLAVEEQMYLVWPVILTFALRRSGDRARTVRWLAGYLAAVSIALALGLHLVGSSNERVYLGTDTRAVAVMLGAFVAGARRTGGGVSDAAARQLETAALAAGLGLVALWAVLDGTWDVTYRGGLLLASFLAAVVVAAAADLRSTRLAAILAHRPVMALGTISYGAYLWHWPIYTYFSEQRTGWDGLVLLVARLAVTVAVAIVSYVVIERPIRERRPPGWWEGWRGFASAVAAVAIAAGAMVLLTGDAQAVPTAALQDGVVRPTTEITGAPKVLVLGDSVAASLAKPAIEDPGAFGVNVVRSTVLGCQVVWDGEHRVRGIEGDVSRPDPCPDRIGELVGQERPDAVVIDYGGWVAADIELNGSWTDACEPAYQQQFEARFAQILEEAGSSGAPVVVVNAARSTNSFRPDDTWDKTACTNEAMARLASEAGATVVDLDAWLCPEGECRTRIDGLFTRSDGVHFTGPGGAKVTRWVLEQVASASGVELEASSSSTEDPALVAVCTSFAQLQGITEALQLGQADDPQLRPDLAEALARFDPGAIQALDPAWAADLQPLAEPELQDSLTETLERALAGDVAAADVLTEDQRGQVDRAMSRLKQIC